MGRARRALSSEQAGQANVLAGLQLPQGLDDLLLAVDDLGEEAGAVDVAVLFQLASVSMPGALSGVRVRPFMAAPKGLLSNLAVAVIVEGRRRSECARTAGPPRRDFSVPDRHIYSLVQFYLLGAI
ncbi:hypothetical protein AB7M17_008685 [Bradyrhizobium sp. USDA 377]